MSDRERVINLLDDLGVVWEEAEDYANDSGQNIVVIGAKRPREGVSPKQDGYMDFYTSLDFTPDGEFVKWGCWE